MSWNDIEPEQWLQDLKAMTIRPDILQRVVLWQLAKRRSGNHQVKEEAEVAGSGKKLFKQKGTGNARQGSKRGPHFRGGAIIFGPHKRDHSFDLPKKVRRLGLRHALASAVKNDALKVYDDFKLDSFKTRDIKSVVADKLSHFKSILFVDDDNLNLLLGIRNIVGFDVLPPCGLNVYDILKHDCVVLNQSVLPKIAERIGGARA